MDNEEYTSASASAWPTPIRATAWLRAGRRLRRAGGVRRGRHPDENPTPDNQRPDNPEMRFTPSRCSSPSAWLAVGQQHHVCFDGGDVTVVDMAVTHAAQTVELVAHAVRGRQSETAHKHALALRTISAANAALQAVRLQDHQPGRPSRHHRRVGTKTPSSRRWAQQAARFQHDSLIRAVMRYPWRPRLAGWLAVPGHDMEALAFYNPERRILIRATPSGKTALGDLLRNSSARPMASPSRAPPSKCSRLAIDIVIPGHGSPFAGVDAAFEPLPAHRQLRCGHRQAGMACHQGSGFICRAGAMLAAGRRIPGIRSACLSPAASTTATPTCRTSPLSRIERDCCW